MEPLDVPELVLVFGNHAYRTGPIEAATPPLLLRFFISSLQGALEGLDHGLELLLIVWLAHFILDNLASVSECRQNVLMLDIIASHILFVMRKLFDLAL